MPKQLNIETGIPIPPRKNSTGIMAALRRLKVGNSFVWKTCHPNNLYTYAEKVGITITVRTVRGDTYRIWRTV